MVAFTLAVMLSTGGSLLLAWAGYRGVTGDYYYTPSGGDLWLWAGMLIVTAGVLIWVGRALRLAGRRGWAAGVVAGALLGVVLAALALFFYLATHH